MKMRVSASDPPYPACTDDTFVSTAVFCVLVRCERRQPTCVSAPSYWAQNRHKLLSVDVQAGCDESQH